MLRPITTTTDETTKFPTVGQEIYKLKEGESAPRKLNLNNKKNKVNLSKDPTVGGRKTVNLKGGNDRFVVSGNSGNQNSYDVRGGKGREEMFSGSKGKNVLRGQAGNDTLNSIGTGRARGRKSKDSLLGGTGKDTANINSRNKKVVARGLETVNIGKKALGATPRSKATIKLEPNEDGANQTRNVINVNQTNGASRKNIEVQNFSTIAGNRSASDRINIDVSNPNQIAGYTRDLKGRGDYKTEIDFGFINNSNQDIGIDLELSNNGFLDRLASLSGEATESSVQNYNRIATNYADSVVEDGFNLV